MTRFAWLQARTQTLTVLGILAVLVGVAAVTGVHMSHLYASLVAHCEARGNCDIAIGDFLTHQSFLQSALDLLLLLFPAIIGTFWGAPLVARELETGTHRLAWTQSVTGTRWLAPKLPRTGAPAVLATGAVSLVVTRWCTRVGLAINAGRTDGSPIGMARIAPPLFEARGIVP